MLKHHASVEQITGEMKTAGYSLAQTTFSSRTVIQRIRGEPDWNITTRTTIVMATRTVAAMGIIMAAPSPPGQTGAIRTSRSHKN